ncbi:MAG: hypothetical protein RR575_05785 [Acinetobacter sp.]
MNRQTELDVTHASISTPTLSTRIKSSSSLMTYRLMIFYRFILAIFGGYVLAALSAIVIAQTFSEYRVASVMSATLLAFSIHCAAFIWVFMVNKTLKASLGIVVPCLVLWTIYKVAGN